MHVPFKTEKPPVRGWKGGQGDFGLRIGDCGLLTLFNPRSTFRNPHSHHPSLPRWTGIKGSLSLERTVGFSIFNCRLPILLTAIGN